MALTLLNAVNETLKRVNLIQGDTGVLTDLTDSAKQHWIDSHVQLWNEVVDELYRLHGAAFSTEASTANVTLVTSTREYTLETDLLSIYWPLINETDGDRIWEYPGGYNQMRKDQLQPSQWTGQPLFAAINPATNKLRMDRAPTAAENGDVYVMFYKKTIQLSLAADTFPFHDEVVRALVPVVATAYKLEDRRDDSSAISGVPGFARAVQLLTQNEPRDSW